MEEDVPVDRQRSKRDHTPLVAVDPRDGKFWHLLVSGRRIQETARRGMGAARTLGYIVPKVLRAPKAVFRGVREEAEKNWLCYVGRPEVAYSAEGEARPPWPDQVFLVFVNEDRIVYNWYWSECAPEDPTLPMDHETRFEEKVL